METLEELKEIIAGKPPISTLYDTNTRLVANQVTFLLGKTRYLSKYRGEYFMFDEEHQVFVEMDCVLTLTRSLSDIERMIVLMEATQGMLQILAGYPDGYWRNEIKAAREALGYE